MGCYGLGVSRVMAAVVEQHHDQHGLMWPATIAPCDVHLVPTGAAQLDAAETLAQELTGRGLRVLLDDRTGVSAGVKFTDAELLGIPRIVVLGRRLAEGFVELRERESGSRTDVPLPQIVDALAG
jgi:prolyl-tRNA synthetase